MALKLQNVASRIVVLKFQEELEKRRQQVAAKPPTRVLGREMPVERLPSWTQGGGGVSLPNPLDLLNRIAPHRSYSATPSLNLANTPFGRTLTQPYMNAPVRPQYGPTGGAQMLAQAAQGAQAKGLAPYQAMTQTALPESITSTPYIGRPLGLAATPATWAFGPEVGAQFVGGRAALGALGRLGWGEKGEEILGTAGEFIGPAALPVARAGVRLAGTMAPAIEAKVAELYPTVREAAVGGEAGGLKLPFGKRTAEIPKVAEAVVPPPEVAAMDFFEGAPKGEKVQRTLIRRHDGAVRVEQEQLDETIKSLVKTARTGGVKLTGGRTEVTERIIGAADFQGPIEEGILKYDLTVGEESLARAIRSEMEAEALRMKAVNPDFNPREFYIPHEWKPKPTTRRTTAAMRAVGVKPYFTKPRALEGSALDIIADRQAQVAAAAETGAKRVPRELDLVTWNPVEIVERRLARGIIYRQEQVLANEMKTQGIAVRVSELGGDLEGWVTPRGFKPFETARIPGTDEVDSWAVPEEIGKAIEDYFGSSMFSTYAPLKGLRNAIANAKFLKTFGGFFQNIDYAFRTMYHATKARDISMLGTPFKAFARAYIPGVDAKMRTWERVSTDLDAVYRRLLIKHGLPTEAGMTFYGQEYREMAKELWAFRIPGMGRYIKAFGSGSYSNAVREYLLGTGAKAVRKAVAAGVPAEEAAARVSLDMSETFSSLPAWQSVFRNPTTRDFMRTGLFSMAENESWIRMPFRQKSFLVSAYISTAVMANMLSLAFNKELLSPDQYNPIRRKEGGMGFEYNTSFMRPKLPWPGPDGRELYLDLVGQADTFFRLIADPEFALKARAGQVPQIAGQLATQEEWFSGKKIENPLEALSFVGRSLAPIPAAAGTQELGRIGPLASAIQAGGMNISAEGLKDLRNRTAAADPAFGKPFDDLGPQAKKDYKVKYPTHFAESEELTEGSPLKRIVEIGEERTRRLDALGKQLDAGKITGQDYVAGRADILTEAAVKSSEYDVKSDTDNPYDLAYGEWMDIIAAAKKANPSGVLTSADFEEVEAKAKAQLGLQKWAMIEEKRMASADPVEKRYLQDRAKMETYWELTDKLWQSFTHGLQGTYDQYRQKVVERLRTRGMGEAYADKDPLIVAFGDFTGDIRSNFLLGSPEVDALLAVWGYNEIVHSVPAAAIYKKRTGLMPRLPADMQ